MKTAAFPEAWVIGLDLSTRESKTFVKMYKMNIAVTQNLYLAL